MRHIAYSLLISACLCACGSGSSSRFYDGTSGMGHDSVRLELRPDGQFTRVTWEGYSFAGTYVETGDNIIFTQPQQGQYSGQWVNGNLKINGHTYVPVDADKPMPKR